MKKLIFLSFLVFVLACTNDSDDSSQTIQDQIKDNVQTSTWRITKYIDSGDDETNHYTGFNFDFGVSNILTASNGTNTYTGTWSITDSNSNDDSSDDLDFNIFFAAPPDFEELSDDWDIITQTSQKIELIDVSGGNGGTDFLTFEKN